MNSLLSCEVRDWMSGRISLLKNWRWPCAARTRKELISTAFRSSDEAQPKVASNAATHLALPNRLLLPLEPLKALILKHMHNRINLADDNLKAAGETGVEFGRLVNPFVVAGDELFVLLDVLREDLVLCVV